MGLSDRQETADHWRAVQPFHRLWHRQGLPSRRAPNWPSPTRVSASRNASPKFAAEFDSHIPGVRLRREPTTSRSTTCSPTWAIAWDGLDGLVHSIGLRPERGHRRQLPGRHLARSLPHRPRHQRPTATRAMAKAALPYAEGPTRLPLLDAVLPGRASAPCPITTPWAWPRPAWKPATRYLA